MRRTVLALVVVVALALAGCNFADGPGGTATPTPTPDAAELPPGVEDGRLTDASALLAAHNRTMVESGFETDLRVNATVVRQEGGTAEVQRRQQTLVEPGTTRYQFRVTNAGEVPDAQFDYWGNRTVEAIRARSDAGVSYATGDPRRADELTTVRFLEPYLDRGNYTVVSFDRGENTTRFTLRTEEIGNYTGLVPANVTNVSNYTSTVVVDSEGRIHAFTATADYEIDGERGSMEARYRVIRTGDVEISRPPWVDQAFAEQ